MVGYISTKIANLCCEHDSVCSEPYLMAEIMTVLQLPPSESFKSRVNLLFLYGTWPLF